MARFDPLKDLAGRFARPLFEAVLGAQNAPHQMWRFTAIAQSHLDAAWKWRVFQTKSKAKQTFKNALRQMANYDEFKFSMSSPQYYEWMKDRNPAIFRAVQDAVRGKHWELVGGMWVEPDLNLPDGESLVRQRLYGQRFYLNNFGRMSEVEWLPDTFGFCWTLPQILAKSGAKYFYTAKPVWNDTTRFPFSTFKWRGPDGSEVLVHISDLQAKGLLNMANYKKTNRLANFRSELVANYDTRPGDIQAGLSNDVIPEAAIVYGMGDGGAGPMTFEVEAVHQLYDAGMVEIGTAKEFFGKLEKHGERLPVWNDEMYLEFHRGCYTTQGWIKSANRKAEIAVRNAEITHTMNSLFGDPYPGEVIRENWRKLLFNQFHDILPGSSIPEVYEDARVDFEEFFSATHGLIRSGIESIGRRIHTVNEKLSDATPVIVFNTLSWKRTSTAFLRVEEEDIQVLDADGCPTNSKVIDLDGHRTLAFTAENVPDIGYKTYYLRKREPGTCAAPAIPTARPLEDGSIQLENELIRAVVDGETGWLVSLVDKTTGAETLAGPSNRLRLYRDDNIAYPAWNIEKRYRHREIEIGPPTSPPTIVDNGELGASVEIKRKIGEASEVSQLITLFPRRQMLIFTTNVNWQEKKAILKVDFDTAIKAERVVSEIPYGAISRPTHPRLPAQKARWELSAHKWIDLSDGTNGLSVLNQDKYGFSVFENKLSVTLLRAPKYPMPIVNAWGLPPASERPVYTDQGEHLIRYAAFPHAGDWRDAKVWRMGAEFSNTLMVVRAEHHPGALPREATALSCSSNSTYIGALKRPEDSPDTPTAKYHQVVVRLVEAEGAHDRVTLKFGPRMTITDSKETDLLEFSQKPIPDQKIGELSVPMKPFEIKTVKITLVETMKLDQ